MGLSQNSNRHEMTSEIYVMRLFTHACLATMLAAFPSMVGCAKDGLSNSSPTATSKDSAARAATQVEAVEVAQRTHLQMVDLPGASVYGFETTLLEAKVGGYVKELSRLKNPLTGELEEVDIGTYAKKGEVLAVLDAPEMIDELNEKDALILQAESEVAQAEAAIRQAEAEVSRAEAALEEARTEYEETNAARRYSEADFQNQNNLFQQSATTRELVDKAKSQLDVALAAIATVNARIRTAAADAKTAEARRGKTEADLRNSQAHVQVAKAARDRVQTLLDYAQIRAPFDGLISKRMVDHGAFVRPATSNSSAMPLFEMTRSDKVRIDANVPMSRAQRIRVGQPVIIHTIGGLPGVTVEGEISRSANVLDQKSRMMNIQVHLTNPVRDAQYIRRQGNWIKPNSDSAQNTKDLVLQPGMYGTVTILKTWEDLAVVPTSAVGMDDSGHQYVMALSTQDGKTVCQSTIVDVVFNDANEVGISGGIKLAQRIVARDIHQLTDGQQVDVKQ